jgi:RNA polymerase sigma factor (TIGR02999 family)
MCGDVTKLLNAMGRGEAGVADELIRVVYAELRQLASRKLAHEKPGHTLDATALVHEAYLRLGESGQVWENRRHFFAAASEAMRRILVESARRKQAFKRGGRQVRRDLEDCAVAVPPLPDDLLDVHEALEKLAAADEQAALLVKCRYFAGLTIPETAEVLGISPRTADRIWAFARAWLYQEIHGENSPHA